MPGSEEQGPLLNRFDAKPHPVGRSTFALAPRKPHQDKDAITGKEGRAHVDRRP